MTFLGWVQVLQLKPQVLILVSGVRPGVRGGRRVECRNRERIARRPPPTEAIVASEMLFRLMFEWQKTKFKTKFRKKFCLYPGASFNYCTQITSFTSKWVQFNFTSHKCKIA